MQTWFLSIFLLAFLLGILASYLFRKYVKKSLEKVNQEYFKGLNFLLNEQPDKAIEVFVKALEVDSDTVELHLSVGGLFRRKGQVDRAIRIHQNLIARTDLSHTHRLHAVYELAQDYYVAGLFDRAENLFIELKESSEFRQQAVEGLLGIYQKQKDWHKAISTINQLNYKQRKQQSKRSAHYWCELAELAINNGQFDEANNALQKSLNSYSNLGRAVLLQGELHYQQGSYVRAIQLWQKMVSEQIVLSELIIEKMIQSYQKLNDNNGLKEYLVSLVAIPKKASAFQLWLGTMQQQLGEVQANTVFYTLLKNDGINQCAANYLDGTLQNGLIAPNQLRVLSNLLLAEAKNNNIEYTCSSCGFNVGALYWHCPSCGEWGSFNLRA